MQVSQFFVGHSKPRLSSATSQSDLFSKFPKFRLQQLHRLFGAELAEQLLYVAGHAGHAGHAGSSRHGFALTSCTGDKACQHLEASWGPLRSFILACQIQSALSNVDQRNIDAHAIWMIHRMETFQDGISKRMQYQVVNNLLHVGLQAGCFQTKK